MAGSDELRVDAFFDTGDVAALERWKREHPDWFEAGSWRPGGAAGSDGGVAPDGRGTGMAWEDAAPLDPREPGFSVADFVAVAARARADAGRGGAARVGDVAGAAGDGFARGFGQAPAGLGAEAREGLRRAGVMAPAEGGGSPLQMLNSALIEGLAVPLDLAVRGLAGVVGAYQAGVAEAGAAIGEPGLGRDLAALPEAFPFGVPRGRLPGSRPQPAPPDMRTTSDLAKPPRVTAYPLLDLPPKPPRPFEADYPRGAQANADGRLATDMEGRPLAAPHIVGRRVVGGEDQAITATELDSVAAGLTGRGIQTAAPGTGLLPRNADGVMQTIRTPDGLVYDLAVSDRLSASDAYRAGAHEIGHLVDAISGKLQADRIPQNGIMDELRQIYNLQANPSSYQRRLFGPADRGYAPDKVPSELMAEAVRAYLTDPNAFKSLAPNTAARIRAAVNEHPTLSKVIQFNAAGGIAYGLSPEPEPDR